MKLRILLIINLLICSLMVKSAHIVGGEITWRCNGSGATIFTAKLYRDCNGPASPGILILQTNIPAIDSIVCNRISLRDVSPVGPGCPTCLAPAGYPNAMQEAIYESGPIILNGTPPSTGWYIWYQDCCRNGGITNINSIDFNIRAIMYPFNNQSISTCFDDSPQFDMPPNFASCCQNYTSLNYAAYDNEFDSLIYEWAEPWEDLYNPANFVNGYSYSNPLPDQSFNPLNIPASLNRHSGTITFQSYTAGTFVLTIKVIAYKCGQKVAEVFRETEFTLSNNCNIGSSGVFNTPPNFNIAASSIQNVVYRDTVNAGDSVSLNIMVTDFQMLDSINPQTFTINAYGNEFGTNFTSQTNGCGVTPCAVLDHAFPYTGSFAGNFNFHWQTACAHASEYNGCLQHMKDFYFVFKANDNFCPFQGIGFQIVAITVVGPKIYYLGQDLAISAANGSTFQWYLDGVVIPGATDSIYSPVQNGNYSVIATSPSGCPMISQSVIRGTTGIISNEELKLTLNINPNPINSNELNVVINSICSAPALLRLFDLNGKVVYQNNLKLMQGTQHLVINPGSLSSGIYSLKVFCADNVMEKKIIIP